jgi:hypothetical protein
MLPMENRISIREIATTAYFAGPALPAYLMSIRRCRSQWMAEARREAQDAAILLKSGNYPATTLTVFTKRT